MQGLLASGKAARRTCSMIAGFPFACRCPGMINMIHLLHALARHFTACYAFDAPRCNLKSRWRVVFHGWPRELFT